MSFKPKEIFKWCRAQWCNITLEELIGLVHSVHHVKLQFRYFNNDYSNNITNIKPKEIYFYHLQSKIWLVKYIFYCNVKNILSIFFDSSIINIFCIILFELTKCIFRKNRMNMCQYMCIYILSLSAVQNSSVLPSSVPISSFYRVPKGTKFAKKELSAIFKCSSVKYKD